MRLTRLKIISFGALENLELELSDRCVIYGENGTGKSTISAFIRVMLFGPDRNDRRRFLPWSGKLMEGELYFEYDGVEYAIYRIIGPTAKVDRLAFTVAATGEAVKTKPAELLGTYSSLLADTLYIAQSSTVFSSSADLSAALRSAAFGQGANAESAVKILEDNRRAITNPRGKTPGSLDMAQMRLEELLDERYRTESQKDKLADIIRRIENAEAALDRARKSYARALTADSENTAALNEKELRLIDEKTENLKMRCKSAENELAACDGVKKTYRNGAFLFRSIFFILAWIFICSGAIFILNQPFASAVLFFLATACVLCYVYFWRSCSKLKAYGIHSDKSAKETIASVKLLTCTLNDIDKKIEELNSQSEKISQELHCAEKSRADAKAEASRCLTEINSLTEEIYTLRREKERLESLDTEAVDARITAARDDVNQLEEQLRSIDAAIEGINSALKKLGERWLPDLAEEIAINAEQLMGKKPKLLIDGELNLKLFENGPKDINLFSSGTKDQIFLSLRLAAAKMLFRTDFPPLILDDPFIQYDDIRQKNAVDMLLKLSAKHQIIFFTCKNTGDFTNKGFKILTMQRVLGYNRL